MPRTRSAEKRVRQNEKRRIRNRAIKTAFKTQIKKVLRSAHTNDTALMQKEYRLAARLLDKAAAKRVIHPNFAARKKSQLSSIIAGKSGRRQGCSPQVRAKKQLASAKSILLRGALERANQKYRSAIALYEGLGSGYRLQLASAHIGRGFVLRELGCTLDAEVEYRESVRLASSPEAAAQGWRVFVPFVFERLSNLLRDEGRNSEAESLRIEALECGRTLENWRDVTRFLSAFDRIAFLVQFDRVLEAEGLCREILDKQRGCRMPPERRLKLFSDLGFILFMQERLSEAEEVLREALCLVDGFRLSTLPVPYRKVILHETAQAVERLFVCLIKAGRVIEASEVDEWGRSRRFSDLMDLSDCRKQFPMLRTSSAVKAVRMSGSLRTDSSPALAGLAAVHGVLDRV